MLTGPNASISWISVFTNGSSSLKSTGAKKAPSLEFAPITDTSSKLP